MTYDPVLILDFDGTLVNTNEVKLRTFELIFPELSNQKVRNLVQTTEGNRYDIIKNIDDLVPLNHRVYKHRDRVDMYDLISTKAVNSASEVYGATKFLKLASKKGLDLYISSATPNSLISGLIAHRGWTSFFKGIYGSPADKTSHINEIKNFLYENSPDNHLAKKIIYIGDTLNDYEAATGTDIEYFGIFLDGQVPKWAQKVKCSQNYINIFKKLGLQ